MIPSAQSSPQEHRIFIHRADAICASRPRASTVMGSLLAAAALLLTASPARAQAVYPTPGAAAEALQQALATHDGDGVRKVLGPGYRQFIPVGTINMDDVYAFLSAYAKHHEIVDDGKGIAHLQAGDQGWTLPVPIMRTSSGWRFDISQAHNEVAVRRIGRNELAAIQTVLAIGDAQRDFAKAKGETVYAQRFFSHPGKQDGLYWPTAEGQAESPLGELARVMDPTAPRGEAYHGYRYRILTAQGPEAPGGALSYITGDAMTGGYAVIAWPAEYGRTGVMTFISGSDGRVYQRNLGTQTASEAARIRRYDPAVGWEQVSSLVGPQ